MTFLPIVGRELRVAARRSGTYWFRLAVAAMALAAGVVMLAGGGSWRSPQQAGEEVFVAVSVAVLCFAAAAGPFVTADTLSVERREGTLGLLFLTDLRGYDVVLGKLAASSLQTAAALLSTLPMLTLPLLAGGVTLTRVVVTALMLALTLAVSLSVSLVCSSFTRNGRLALLAAVTTLGLLAGLPWVELLIEGQFARGQPTIGAWLMLASPPYLVIEAISQGTFMNPSPGKLWAGISFQLLVVAGSIGLACWRLPRLVLESEPLVTKAVRPSRRSGGVHSFWLAASDRAARRFLFRVALFLSALIALLVVLALAKRKEIFYWGAMPVAYFLHVLLKCQFAAEATDRFHHDRVTGGLEVLLSSPLPVPALLTDYWRGLRRRFAASRLLVLSVNTTFVLVSVSGILHPRPPDEAFWWLLGLLITGTAFVWLDCRALAWSGLRAALRARTPGRAMLGAVARILMPAWVALFFWFLLLTQNLIGPSEKGIRVSLVLWAVLFTAWDLWRAWRDRRWLEQNLRAAAAGELLRQGVWARLWEKFLLRKAAKSRQCARPESH